MPLQSALWVEIIRLARVGAIPGALGRRFRTVVGIGHSLSSTMLNDLIMTAPDVLDAAIFTGVSAPSVMLHQKQGSSRIQFSHATPSGTIIVPGFVPAREALPARFGHLPAGYLTTNTIDDRAQFYGPPGTFDPAVLQFDEAHKDLVTVNEIATSGPSEVAAPEFRGDILTVAGVFDAFFCLLSGCANLAGEVQFYPAARSVEFGESGESNTSLRTKCHFSCDCGVRP